MSAPVCPLCKGRGERNRLIGDDLLASFPCPVCDGSGTAERREGERRVNKTRRIVTTVTQKPNAYPVAYMFWVKRELRWVPCQRFIEDRRVGDRRKGGEA